MSAKFIILGDVHIGGQISVGKSIAGSALNSRVIDQLNLLDWTMHQAIDNFCSDIIITGDIWEEPMPENYLISAFMSWLNDCSNNNINVHIILGNHDFVKLESKYYSSLDIIRESNINGVSVYKNLQTIYIDDCAISLLPYNDRKTLEKSSNTEALHSLQESLIYEASSIPNTFNKILIGHQAIKGSIYVGNEFDDLDNELFLEISDVSLYDFTWMGHIHSPQVMSKHKPYVAHIGSMDRSSFLETEQEKHIIIFNSSLPNKFIKKVLPTRDLKKISISIPEDISDATEYALDIINKMDSFNNSIIKIDFTLENSNSLPLNKNKIEKVLLKNGAYNICNITETKKSIQVNKKKIDNVDSLEKVENVNSKVDVGKAIELFAELFIKEDDRNSFKELANEIILEVKNETA